MVMVVMTIAWSIHEHNISHIRIVNNFSSPPPVIFKSHSWHSLNSKLADEEENETNIFCCLLEMRVKLDPHHKLSLSPLPNTFRASLILFMRDHVDSRSDDQQEKEKNEERSEISLYLFQNAINGWMGE